MALTFHRQTHHLCRNSVCLLCSSVCFSVWQNTADLEEERQHVKIIFYDIGYKSVNLVCYITYNGTCWSGNRAFPLLRCLYGFPPSTTHNNKLTAAQTPNLPFKNSDAPIKSLSSAIFTKDEMMTECLRCFKVMSWGKKTFQKLCVERKLNSLEPLHRREPFSPSTQT